LNINASNLKNQEDMYLSHFIRGYFAGDGNINPRGYVVSFVGRSLDFMVALENHVKTCGFKVNLTKKEKKIIFVYI
jgi:LAGLIDADG-like domain